MRVMKICLTLALLFGLQGCFSSSKNYYVLSMVSQPKSIYTSKKHIIGVEKITVPSYLYKRELAIAKSTSEITLLGNALWGEDLDEGLTNRLIGFLQKKFNQADIYAYPWGTDKQPTLKVSVKITRFIAQGEYVYLDATWSLENVKTKKRRAKLFSTKVVTNSANVQSIVRAMDTAFSKFEETVARGIREF